MAIPRRVGQEVQTLRAVSRRRVYIDGDSTAARIAKRGIAPGAKESFAVRQARADLVEATKPQSKTKKFSYTEVFLGILVCVALDAFAFFVLEVETVTIGASIFQIIVWLIFTFWFTIKGCTGTSGLVKRYLLPILLDALPVIPPLTISFLATWLWEDHKGFVIAAIIPVIGMPILAIKKAWNLIKRVTK